MIVTEHRPRPPATPLDSLNPRPHCSPFLASLGRPWPAMAADRPLLDKVTQREPQVIAKQKTPHPRAGPTMDLKYVNFRYAGGGPTTR